MGIPTSLSPYQACYVDCLDTQTGVNCQTYCENHDTTAVPKTDPSQTTDSPSGHHFVEDLFVLLLILFVFDEIKEHHEPSSSFQFGSNLLLVLFLTMMARRFMN